MKIIHAVHPEDFVKYNTQQIRDKFLLDKLVEAGKINCVYTHYDRMVVGAATPSSSALKLETYDQLKSENFALDSIPCGEVQGFKRGVFVKTPAEKI